MPQDQQPKTELTLDEFRERARERYGIPKPLWESVRSQESGGDPSAVSPTGVRGEFQVTKGTARAYGLDRDDPFHQVAAAARNLREGYDRYKDQFADENERWLSASAYYYFGGDAVGPDGKLSERSKDGISTPQKYVTHIAERWKAYNDSQDAAAPQSAPQPTQAPQTKPARPAPVRSRAETALLGYDPKGYDRQGRGLSTPGAKEAQRRQVLTGQIKAFEDLKAQGDITRANAIAADIKKRWGDLMEVGESQGWPYIKPKPKSGFTAPQPPSVPAAPSADDYNRQSWLERRRRNIATGYDIGAQALSDALARGIDITSSAASGDFRPLMEQAEGAGRGLMKLASAFDPAGNAYGAVAPEQNAALTALERRRAERLKDDPYTIGSNLARQRLAEEEKAQPGFGGAVTRGVVSGGVQAIPYFGASLAGGGIPTLAGVAAAQSDFTRPEEAALNIAGATVPIPVTRALTPAINRAAGVLPGKIAQGAARAAGQVGVGSGVNVTQALVAGERDPRKLAETAVVGGVLSGRDAAMQARRSGAPIAPRGVDPAIVEAAASTPGRTPITVTRAGHQSTFGAEGELPRASAQNAADIGIRQAVDRYTRRADEINRSNIDPGQKAAQLAQARAVYQAERQAARQAQPVAEAPSIEPQAPTTAPDAATTPVEAQASVLPPGVQIIRVGQGEQIPPRGRGQRQIPFDVEQPDGTFETVLVLAPERIDGRRVNETMLRPMVEQALRPPVSTPAAQPVTETGATTAEPPRSQPTEPSRWQPPPIQFTQLGPEGLRTARAPEEALPPQARSRATNTLQRDPGGAILAPESPLANRKLLAPGRPEDVPTEQLDVPPTRPIPIPDAPVTQESSALTRWMQVENAPTAELPALPGRRQTAPVRQTAEIPRQPAITQEPTNRITEGEGGELQRYSRPLEGQPVEMPGPRRLRTERLSVPKATNKNIEALRKRQEELGRLAYDRRGDFTGDLRDEYNQLTAHIRDYDNEQARVARGGRLEDTPPLGMRPERSAPMSPEERTARRAVLQPKPETARIVDTEQPRARAVDPADSRQVNRWLVANLPFPAKIIVRRIGQITIAADAGKDLATHADAIRQALGARSVSAPGLRNYLTVNFEPETGGRSRPKAAPRRLAEERLAVSHLDPRLTPDQRAERFRQARAFYAERARSGQPNALQNKLAEIYATNADFDLAMNAARKELSREFGDKLTRDALVADLRWLYGEAETKTEALSAETGRKIQHSKLGEVTESPNQSGVPKGSLRVIDADGGEHFIQNPRTRGNREAAFVRPSTGAIPAEAMIELRDPNAPPSPLEQMGKPLPSRGRQSYAIPEKAMPELRGRRESKGHIMGSGFGALQGLFERGAGPKPPAPEPQPGDLTRREHLGRKIATTQTAAQLLNPKTIAQNLIGNAAFSGAKNAATVAAIPVDKFLSFVTKKRQVSTPELRTQFNDFAGGFADIYHAVRSNDYAALAGNRYELSNERVFKGKVGGFFEDALNIALRAPDKGAYLAAYNDSVQQILKAHAKSKTKFALDKIHDQAKVEAQQSVFQDSNIISDFTVKLRDALNVVTPFGKRANFGLGDLVGLKYARTPANLLARGIEYSPLNFVNAFYKIGKVMAGKGKDFDQRNAALAFGKAFVGSAFGSSLGAALYSMGIITQPEQENRGVQAAERAEGLTGYQLNLSALKRYASGGLLGALTGDLSAGEKQAGDVLMSYDWMQPWAFSVGMGAAASKAFKNRKADADVLEDTLTQIDAVTSTLTDQSILRNIRDSFRFGVKSTGRKIITDTPASFVPAVLNQARQIIDDRAREISREKGAGGIRREALDKVLNRLPGASKRLPERKDIIGRSVPSRMEGAGGAALVPIPGRFSKYNPHPVLTETQNVGSGTTGITRKDGEPEGQFRARKALAAEWRNKYGLELTASKAYKEASKEERKASLDYLNEQISGQSGKQRPSLYLFAPGRILRTVREREREKKRKAAQAGAALQ